MDFVQEKSTDITLNLKGPEDSPFTFNFISNFNPISQEMMGLDLVVVPKQDLKLPVRSSETSETAVPLEGPIGMLIVSGCRIVS